MISIKQIKDRLRRWKRRRDFDRLPPLQQLVVIFFGDDPDTLEAKEREEEGAK